MEEGSVHKITCICMSNLSNLIKNIIEEKFITKYNFSYIDANSNSILICT